MPLKSRTHSGKELLPIALLPRSVHQGLMLATYRTFAWW